jgi:hypothetical protein
MIQKEPAVRGSANFYLQQFRGLAFPDTFPFLHAYVSRCSRLTSDDKVHTVRADVNQVSLTFCLANSRPLVLMISLPLCS